jgi:hypothetical protein
MSAGAFVRSRYAASYAANVIHPIKVQPETLGAAITATPTNTNAPPTAAGTNPISAQVSRSTRALGLHARLVSLRIAGTPPTGYSTTSTVRIPALNVAFFQAAQLPGAQVTYLGATWNVVGTRGEEVR